MTERLYEIGSVLIMFGFISLPSFFYMRIQFENIISYVIGDKVFKEEYKEQSLKDRFWFNKYRIIFPKWMIVWYKAELACILSIIPLVVMTYCFKPIMFLLMGIMVFLVSPLWFRIYLMDKYRGDLYKYSKIVDKYAIRKKLYPELYDEETEETGDGSEN